MAFLDESGVLMAPLVRRTWSPQGHTPILLHRTRAHQKVSVIAALCVPPSRDRVQLYFRLHPNRNITAVEVVAFLRQLRHQLGGPIVLLWDRLRAHRAVKVQTFLTPPTRIHPVFFPPYAPELNPIEYAWGYLKGNPLANWAPLDVDGLVAGARHANRALQHRPDLLRSFVHHSPLLLRLK
ncbi:MAG: transposase [Candidatus Methylomirabilales bacterium]